MNEPIRCPECSHVLGVRLTDGRVEVRHRGRRMVGQLDTIACECCPGVWRADMNKDRDTLPVLVGVA